MMRMSYRLGMCVLACALVLAAGTKASGQVKFDRGQNVVPVFEGWMKNADGTFTMVFGYFNRNWQEELTLPVGPGNTFEPGAADRGQPTYFLPRRQRYMVLVPVPADWGKRDLVWTLTANGVTEKAYGSLHPELELKYRNVATGGNFSGELEEASDGPVNRQPTVAVDAASTISLPNSLTLTASVTDDGLPKPRPVRPNQTPRPQGLRVTWMQYRGPGKVSFTPADPISVTNGRAVATATFSMPGTYVFRAMVTDGEFQTPTLVTVTVNSGPSTRVQR